MWENKINFPIYYLNDEQYNGTNLELLTKITI